MPGPLALSPDATSTRTRFGAEAQPLLRVEQALADPAAVIAIAARHHFGQHGPHYPGIRAAVSSAVAMPLVEPLLLPIAAQFGLTRPPQYRECFLSLVTLEPGDLAPIQRLPHFDGVEPERLAVLLYLDRAERGGTGFYCQRSTGFEYVAADRFDRYRTALEAGVEEHGLPGPAYIAGDTPLFEQVHREVGRFNSMVVYRGNSLHCAALDGDFRPDPDPATGRLTLNLFLD